MQALRIKLFYYNVLWCIDKVEFTFVCRLISFRKIIYHPKWCHPVPGLRNVHGPNTQNTYWESFRNSMKVARFDQRFLRFIRMPSIYVLHNSIITVCREWVHTYRRLKWLYRQLVYCGFIFSVFGMVVLFAQGFSAERSQSILGLVQFFWNTASIKVGRWSGGSGGQRGFRWVMKLLDIVL